MVKKKRPMAKKKMAKKKTASRAAPAAKKKVAKKKAAPVAKKKVAKKKAAPVAKKKAARKPARQVQTDDGAVDGYPLLSSKHKIKGELRDKSPGRIQLGAVRLCFTHNIVQRNQNDKYGCVLLIPPEQIETPDGHLSADITVLEQAVDWARAEMWGAKTPRGFKNPIKDGDDPEIWGEDEKYRDSFEGNWAVNVSSLDPLVKSQKEDYTQAITLDREPIYLEEFKSKVKSGYWANVILECFPYDKQNKGVGVQLCSLQLVCEDEVLGGSQIAAADEFGDEDDDGGYDYDGGYDDAGDAGDAGDGDGGDDGDVWGDGDGSDDDGSDDDGSDDDGSDDDGSDDDGTWEEDGYTYWQDDDGTLYYDQDGEWVEVEE